jgi:hypothetical protein
LDASTKNDTASRSGGDEAMAQAKSSTSKNATKTTSARAKSRPAVAATKNTKPAAVRKSATRKPAPAPAPVHVEPVVAAVPQAPERRKPGRIALKLALTLALMTVVGGVAGFGTWSAFSSTTQNTGNTFAAGTVIIGDNDGGTTPMLSFANASPGTTDTSCVTVTYTGSLASSVRLYGTTSGTGLDQYLNLVVTRGSGAAGFDDCTGFTPDPTDLIGAGNGVIYSGTLQGFPDNYGAALVDPVAGSPESWTNPESHQYRFVVTVADNNAAQGLDASQSFTWEARNN